MDNNNLERALTGRTSLDKDITVTVGSNGDFATINKALEELSKFYPLYKKKGYTAEIKLKAGFVMEEQVLVDGIDLGWITITGEDDETTINEDSLTIGFRGDYYAAFGARNGTLPAIQQVFNVNNTNDNPHNIGIHLYKNSKVDVNGGGIKNNVYAGLYVENSSIASANNSVFTNCNYGILANNSIVNCAYANCSDVLSVGVYAARCANINFNGGTATNTSDVSIHAALGGKVSAYFSNCSTNNDNKYEYYVSGGGLIVAHSATGGTKTNVAVNTLNAAGIIFR